MLCVEKLVDLISFGIPSGSTARGGESHSPVDLRAPGGETCTAQPSTSAGLTKACIVPIFRYQSNCCVGAITSSGMMCSDTQEAPCIINNDGTSCGALVGLVATPVHSRDCSFHVYCERFVGSRFFPTVSAVFCHAPKFSVTVHRRYIKRHV